MFIFENDLDERVRIKNFCLSQDLFSTIIQSQYVAISVIHGRSGCDHLLLVLIFFYIIAFHQYQISAKICTHPKFVSGAGQCFNQSGLHQAQGAFQCVQVKKLYPIVNFLTVLSVDTVFCEF